MNVIETDLLATLCGATDGTLEAQALEGMQWQADLQAMQAFHASGGLVTFHRPGQSGAARKAQIRALAKLQTAGMVSVADGGRRAGLTPVGDDAARRLIGLPCLADAMPMIDFLASRENDGKRWQPGAWLSESTLAGREPLPPGKIGMERTPAAAVGTIAAHVAPLLTRNLISWRTVYRLDGVYLYALTVTGAALAKVRKADAGAWLRIVKRYRHPATPASYDSAWTAAYSNRQTARPMHANLVQHQDPVDAPTRYDVQRIMAETTHV